MKMLIMGSRNFYPILVPLFGRQVSGVSVQLNRRRSRIHLNDKLGFSDERFRVQRFRVPGSEVLRSKDQTIELSRTILQCCLAALGW